MTHIPVRYSAEYLRMSTDVQDLSLDIQRKAIRSYAEARGIAIMASYEDEGRSGLTLHNRPAMKRLLHDVAEESCPFSLVLVYDVSRWGRFQDTDASAYYEYHCRLHGVNVIYVEEPFAADASPMSALIKSLKRAMAAEYSRELAVKTTAGQSCAIESGFQMGQTPCIGISRVAVSQDGQTRFLPPGDRKAKQSEHIRWIPGPEHEIEAVRRIFDLYATTEISIRGLAQQLATEGVVAASGRPITERMLCSLLECEAFIGNFLWGRYDHSMRRRPMRRKNGEKGFTRAESILQPIVEKSIWQRAQAKRHSRGAYVLAHDELLERLRAALEQNPALGLIELQSYGCPSYVAYASAFGSFREALRLAGRDHAVARQYQLTQQLRVQQLSKRVTEDICKLLRAEGVSCTRIARHHVLVLAGEVRIRVQVVCRRRWRDQLRWWFVPRRAVPCHFVMLARVEKNDTAGDLLLLGWNEYLELPKWLEDEAPAASMRLCSVTDVLNKLRELALGHRMQSPFEKD